MYWQLLESKVGQHLHVKIEESLMFKHPFLFVISIKYVLMIKEYIWVYIHFSLKECWEAQAYVP